VARNYSDRKAKKKKFAHMRLIDTHCHLYLKEFEHDLEEVMQRGQQASVEKFYLPCIDSSVIEAMLRLEGNYPGTCLMMMGLHPCSVQANYTSELTIVEGWLAKRTFAAIGEIGLDFYWDTTFEEEQYAAFVQQMEWALQYNLPIVIHTRNAMQQTIDTVKPFATRGLRGIFHCFGDNATAAQQIIDMGFLLGIGGVLTYKKAGLPAMLQDIGLEHIVLETDAPYLSPVPFRGKRNESSYLLHIAGALAAAKNVPLEEVAAVTTLNAEKLFRQ
jgi:TatD DNase family protein